MLHLLKFNYLRITVILTLKSMEIDKRSNIEHHVRQAVTLAITSVIHHQQISYQNHLKYISS